MLVSKSKRTPLSTHFYSLQLGFQGGILPQLEKRLKRRGSFLFASVGATGFYNTNYLPMAGKFDFFAPLQGFLEFTALGS